MRKLGIVVSEFNPEITGPLCDSALAQCQKYHLTQENILLIHVPGAVEIPLAAKLLCKKADVEAVICLGAVIRGETGHYQFVCDQVSFGCQKVALDHEKPVIFGVLTTDNEAQAQERISKGAECVDAAFKMLAVNETLSKI
jgi:6,7-dimethyl-8-ribityllumazine synthase